MAKAKDETPAPRTPRKPGNRLTAAAKVVRDRKVCQEKARGRSDNAIAAKYDIAPQTVRRLWAEYRVSNKPKLQGEDPLDIVWRFATRYESWISDLAEIAIETEYDAVRVGAIRAQMTAQGKLAELLQATGILPRELGRLRFEADVRFVTETMLTIFEQDKVPVETQRRLVEALGARRN